MQRQREYWRTHRVPDSDSLHQSSNEINHDPKLVDEASYLQMWVDNAKDFALYLRHRVRPKKCNRLMLGLIQRYKYTRGTPTTNLLLRLRAYKFV